MKRLWQIPGTAPFGLLYCCARHQPGSGPRYTDTSNPVAALRQRLEGRTFYEVTPLAS